jgi:glucans biosynthesis protein
VFATVLIFADLDSDLCHMIDRRTFLASATASAALAALGYTGTAKAAPLSYSAAKPFSFDGLVDQARSMADKPYAPAWLLPADVLDRIDYEAHGKIQFKTDFALFNEGPGKFPVTFFHLGQFFRVPVQMFLIDRSGNTALAREIAYDDAYFDMPEDSPAHELPHGAGFAGFRFQEARDGRLDWKKNDWVAFLGASYFRAIGELYQYGLSARGVAVNVAEATAPEEFPDFSQFYFEPPQPDSDVVTVYALLNGPSLTGAYRFDMRRGAGVVMDVDCALFLRKDIARFGIAPLTSMYWYSETEKPTAVDWRPEVHDSDGLAMWTGSGEHLWRPLNNPPRTTTSAFMDQKPRGFGLLQRDRNFDNYLDGVHYDKRPSLWIEPIGDWGKGAVQLVEITTDDEIHDNVVAMWVPSEPARKGQRHRYKYRMHWLADEPFPTPLARCVATRLGNGGQPGQPRPADVRKFMVEFYGPPLVDLPFGTKPEPILSASRGSFPYLLVEAVPNDRPGHWRIQFDLAADGADPIELRLFLKAGDRTLSETWSFQYHPFPTHRTR